mgnify:CR=1 FL=1
MTTALVIENLTKTYKNGFQALKGINLRVEQGEFYALLGPNGAGKSTTIRILLGLLKPESGSASILGKDCWRDGAAIRRDVGYVAGDVRLYPWLTLERGIKLLKTMRPSTMPERARQLAERFHLEPHLPARKMSRGNRQKLALILALAHDPRVVILDEPTSGLDPLMQDTLMAILRELALLGHTILFSSHTLAEVESLCDRIAVIRDGQIIVDDKLSTLRQQAPRRIVATFSNGRTVPQILPDGCRVLWKPGRTSSPSSEEAELAGIPPAMLSQTCVFEVSGTVSALLPWLHEHSPDDFSVGAPSLDALFREYYQQGQGKGL